jgi:tetratricopeptide (TPR) repeat protein
MPMPVLRPSFPPARRAALLVTSLALCALPASAQMFKDAALQALHLADRPGDLQRTARERLAAQPGDSQAVLALALAALAGNDAPARQQAIARAETCTQEQPQAAACHYALGVVLGVQAMSEGLLKAARSAGTVKTALTQAQTLEPSWFPARSALVDFYLLAPGMMGGSTTKAQELARGAPTPDQVRVLQARVDLQAGRAEVALQGLAGLLSASDPELADDAVQWGMQAGMKLVNDGQGAKAQPFFERMLRERPAAAAGAYGLARVRSEAGAHAEALKLLDQAALGKGAASLPVDYRRGIALQALGRSDEARVALSRFVAAGKGQKSALEDARKRLEQIGG